MEVLKEYWTVVWEFLLDANRAAAVTILLTVLTMILAGIAWFFGLFGKREKTVGEVAPPNGKLELTFSLEEYETRLAHKITEAETKLRTAHDEDKAALQNEISELRRRAGDPEASLQEARETIAKLEQALEREGNEIGADQLAEAKGALEAGDFSLADELFALIEAHEDLAVSRAARAAFSRGEIAKQEVRWADAARHYGKAAQLEASYQHLLSAREFAWRSGKYDVALQFGTALLEIAENEFGGDGAEFATALNEHAITLKDLGRYAEAEPLYRQAIEIGKKTLGQEHPNYATRLNNLAGLLEATGRFEEAGPMYQQMIAILEGALGMEHPNTIGGKRNYELFLAAREAAEKSDN